MEKLRHIILLLFSIIASVQTVARANTDSHIDSLLNIVSTMPNDTIRLKALNEIAYEHYSVDTVAKYAQLQLDLAKQLHNGYYEAKALSYLYWCNFHFNDFIKANDYAFKAIVIGDSIGNKRIVASNYLNLGITYSMMQDATQADNYYHKALDMFTQMADSTQMCEVLRNIGYNDNLYEMFDASEECYRRALQIDQRLGDLNSLSEDYLGLGDMLYNKSSNGLDFDTLTLLQAKKYYLQAYNTAKKANHDYSLFIVKAELPMVLITEINCMNYTNERRSEILDSCKLLLTKGYVMADKFGYETDKIDIDFGWISYFTTIHQFDKAQSKLDSLKVMFETATDVYKHQFAKLYSAYTLFHKEKGNYKQAYEAHVKYEYFHRQSRKKDYEITARLNMAQAQFDNLLNLQQQRELTLKNEADKNAILSIASIVVLMLVSVLTIVIAWSYLKSRKTNALLDAKNNELEQQKEETLAQNECLARQNEQIEKQNKIITKANNAITDSINYASIIQRAALPSEKLMSSIFAEYMVVYKPLNIVSGDFYWTTQIEHYKMIAVADCTGHGVPGAFLSMLGMSILDYLAKNVNKSMINAGQMLDNVRSLFKQSLHQTDEGNHDGIDMALLIIDSDSGEAHYAGAFRPLIVAHNGQLARFEPDRMPIGVHYKEAEHFTDNLLHLQKNDIIYMYSDGVTDQFGYAQNGEVKKYTSRQFMQLLTEVNMLSLANQKVEIEKEMERWITNSDGEKYEQTDDAVIVGIRV